MSERSMPRDFEGLKKRFLAHLELRNFSPLSVRQHEQYLRIFIDYAHALGVTDPGKVDERVFEQYKAYLSTGYVTRKGKPLTTNTIVTRLGSIKLWFAWMKKKGVVFFDPLAAVKMPRKTARLPRGVLTLEEIQAVMAQPVLKTLLGYRDRTMMEVLYASGARARELCRLRVPDVDLGKKTVRINYGKGGRDRFAPLTSTACRFLERYLEEFRPKLAACIRPAGRDWLKKAGTGEDFVFLSAYGGPMNSIWLSAIMRRYIQAAGIKRPVSPVHGFRHSLATHLIGGGMDVRYVQVLLGHKSINSTQIYTHVERETLHRQLKAHHPLALRKESALPFVDDKEAHVLGA